VPARLDGQGIVYLDVLGLTDRNNCHVEMSWAHRL
jgi:hypothetical protein